MSAVSALVKAEAEGLQIQGNPSKAKQQQTLLLGISHCLLELQNHLKQFFFTGNDHHIFYIIIYLRVCSSCVMSKNNFWEMVLSFCHVAF